MEEILCISLYVIFFVYGWKREKFIFNPLTMFSAIWLLVICCSLTHYKLNKPSEETLLMLSIGVVVFFCGTLLARHARRCVLKYGKMLVTCNGSNFKIRYNLVIVLCFVCILAYAYNLVTLIQTVGSGNLALIKQQLQESFAGRSSWVNAFYFLIVDPLTIALPICAIADFIYGKKDKTLVGSAILLTLLKTITNTTRSTFGIIVIYFVIGTLMYIRVKGYDKSIKRIIKKLKKQIIVACLFTAVLFVWMTFARGLGMLDNLWTDFALPTSLFEYWKAEVDKENTVGYGLASLNGFVYPFFYFLKNVFGIPIPMFVQSIYDLVGATDSFVWASNRVIANAYVSAYWYLYLDFRYLGIVIGMFLMGYFSEKNYQNMLRNQSGRNFVVYSFFVQMIIFSIVRIPFTVVSTALGFLYALLLFKKCKET